MLWPSLVVLWKRVVDRQQQVRHRSEIAALTESPMSCASHQHQVFATALKDNAALRGYLKHGEFAHA